MKSIARRLGRRGIAVAVLLVFAAATTVVAAQAREESSRSASGPKGSVAAKAIPKVAPKVFDGDVRNLPQVPSQPMRKDRETEIPLTVRQPAAHPSTPARSISTGTMPSPIQNFPGMKRSDSCGAGTCGAGSPPDTNGDVGPVYYIQSVNSSFGIFDKTTGTRVAAFTENALWAGTGTFCDGHGGGDPVVIHDPAADRWILTNLAYGSGASTGPFDQCIAVSQTSDPVTGGWYLYDLRMDQGAVPVNTLNDYPKLGIWTDCLYFAFNGFLNGASYNGSGFGSLSKSDMYAGQAVTGAIGFLAGSGSDAFTMIPSNLEDTNGLPPSGRPDYFVSESLSVFGYRVRAFTAGANC